MSVQRRRGEAAIVYGTKIGLDNRGDEVVQVDLNDPLHVRAAFVPQRSARAEVPGQQQINVVTMLVRDGLPNVNLWSRVNWDGKNWDVVSPPARHRGTRHTRHWSLDLRERPS